jgi:hypothetical protein
MFAHHDWHAKDLLADISELHWSDTHFPLAPVGDTVATKGTADNLVAETNA